jgi:GNAT superfamily N-acetyltransferase
MELTEIKDNYQKKEIAKYILESLPEWFGIPESTKEYIDESCNLPFFAVFNELKPLGFIVLKENNAYTAEIFVMGVLPNHQKKGIGRMLYHKVYNWAKDHGYEYLQVKTLDSSHPDLHYAITRKFYLSMGFKPFECIPVLWGKDNPCLIMVQYIGE